MTTHHPMPQTRQNPRTAPLRGYYAPSCEGKQRLTGKNIADRIASRMRRRRGEYVLSYRCEYCHAWHIGHPGGPTLKQRKDAVQRRMEGDLA